MTRVEYDEIEDKELCRIYLARKFKEAQMVESLLTNEGITYAVKVEPYLQGLLFKSEYQGAAFYVITGQAEFCRNCLITGGFKSGVVNE